MNSSPHPFVVLKMAIVVLIVVLAVLAPTLSFAAVCSPGQLLCSDGYQKTPFPANVLLQCNPEGSGYVEVAGCLKCVESGTSARCNPPHTVAGRFASYFYLPLICILLFVGYFTLVRSAFTTKSDFIVFTFFYGLFLEIMFLFIDIKVFWQPFGSFFFLWIPTLIGSTVLFCILNTFKRKMAYTFAHAGLLLVPFAFILGIIVFLLPAT